MDLDTLLEQENEPILVTKINNAEPIEISDIFSMRRITKKLTSLQKYDNLTEEGLKEAIRYNQRGIEMLKGSHEEKDRNSIIHFNRSKGSACSDLYLKTEMISYADLGYDALSKAAMLLHESNQDSAAYQYKFAAKLAGHAYRITKDPSWLKKQYQSYRRSAEISDMTDATHSANCYFLAGKAAKELARNADGSKKRKMFMKSRDCFESAYGLEPVHYTKNRITSEMNYVNRMILLSGSPPKSKQGKKW